MKSFLIKKLYLDSHVAMTLILRSWNILAGLGLIFTIALYLKDDSQGYFYTFNSLIALQVFFELGITQVITQVVAHESAHLKYRNGAINGDAERIMKLINMVGFIKQWYAVVTILYFLLVGVGGYYFFKTNEVDNASIWIAPWLILILFSSLNLYINVWFAFLEGFNRVNLVARVRITQSILGYSLMWIGLSMGADLYAAPIVMVVAVAYSISWFLRSDNELSYLYRLYKDKVNSKLVRSKKIFSEIASLQWRIAISWISGYLTFQLFTPLIFVHYGPIEAGKFGMTNSIFTAISAIGTSWMAAKLPQFSHYISIKDRSRLDKEFSRIFIISILFVLFACITFLTVIQTFRNIEVMQFITDKISDFEILACFSFVTIVNAAILSMANYMRAHKKEPMLIPSVLTGILVSASSLILIEFGIFQVMIGYAIILCFIILPIVYKLKKKFQNDYRKYIL